MPTILKTGRWRCDAVCHQANGDKCTCICNGKFHGAQIKQSKTAERTEIEEIVLTKAMIQAAAVDAMKLLNNDQQPSLFTDEDLTEAYAQFSKGN